MPPSPALDDQDAHFFREGTHSRLYETLGCHPQGEGGVNFAVWAPNAARVSVIGEWNGWTGDLDVLDPASDGTGIWRGHAPSARRGHGYKYRVHSKYRDFVVDKADPFAFYAETPPATASRVWSLEYEWNDASWMSSRHERNSLEAPISVYEVHLGSWRRDGSRVLSYQELAPLLADYALDLGFTHVELMPVTEHPFYGSWGYQTTSYFAPTSRLGTPQDFMAFVDHLHQRGLGVWLDWVPSHFPGDEHGLVYFDGTHLFEHSDPRQGIHPGWNSVLFNYGRPEVRSFLVSSGLFWLNRYHLDGLRVDAVASMLHLDEGRDPGEWIPNHLGGRENLDAVEFLRTLNQAAHREHEGVLTIAEESSTWPRVSRPVEHDGLGFSMKWNMGWMNDTLAYMTRPWDERARHHHLLTFATSYLDRENFILPLSHDEVVYGKRSLLEKMPGDSWQRFAGLRALLGFMWGHPGKKLLFMGGEFGQRPEWTHDGELDWGALAEEGHAGVRRFVTRLNDVYRRHRALHELDFSARGIEWVMADDAATSVFAFLRWPRAGGSPLLVVCNLTATARPGQWLGVPEGGHWREVLSSDGREFGGAGGGHPQGVEAGTPGAHDRPYSLRLDLPALSTLILEPSNPAQVPRA